MRTLMKAVPYLVLVLTFLVGSCFAMVDAPPAQTAPEIQVAALAWAFLNSPIGIVVVGAVLGAVLGKVFTAKPEWRKLYDDHRGVFFDAVKFAEQAIPDDTPNKTVRKIDEALKFVLKTRPELDKADRADLQKALADAHDTLKANASGSA